MAGINSASNIIPPEGLVFRPVFTEQQLASLCFLLLCCKGLGSPHKWCEKSPNSEQGMDHKGLDQKHKWPCDSGFFWAVDNQIQTGLWQQHYWSCLKKQKWLCRKECTTSSSKGFSCKALQEQGVYCTSPGQYCSSSLPPEKRNVSQEQQSPLTPPLASRGSHLTAGALQGIRCSFSGTNCV